jgi:hypothetical protein
MPVPHRRLPSVLYTPISLKAGIALIFVGTVSLLGLFGYSFFLWFTARSLEVAPTANTENVSPTPIPDSSIPATPIPTTPISVTPIPTTPVPTTPISATSVPTTPIPTTPIPTTPVPITPIPASPLPLSPSP